MRMLLSREGQKRKRDRKGMENASVPSLLSAVGTVGY